METKKTMGVGTIDESLGYKMLFYSGLHLTHSEANDILTLLAKELFLDVNGYFRYQTVKEMTAKIQEISNGKIPMFVLNKDKQNYIIGKAKEFLLIQKYLDNGSLPFPAYTVGLKNVGPFCYTAINSTFTAALKASRLELYFQELEKASDKVRTFYRPEIQEQTADTWTPSWIPMAPNVTMLVNSELGYPIYFLKTDMPGSVQKALLNVLKQAESCASYQGRLELSMAIQQLLQHKSIMLTPVLEGCDIQSQFCGPKACHINWWKDAGILSKDDTNRINNLQTEVCKSLQGKQDCIQRKTVLLYAEMVNEPIFFLPVSRLDHATKNTSPIYLQCMQKIENMCFPDGNRTQDQIALHCTCMKQLFTNKAIPLNLPGKSKEEMDSLFSLLQAKDHQLAHEVCDRETLAQIWSKMGRPFKMEVCVTIDTHIETGCSVRLDLLSVKMDAQFNHICKDSLLTHLSSSNSYDQDTFTVLSVNGETCRLDRYLEGQDIPMKYVVRVR